MEKFRNCPICSEVPEKEIYQCAEGHVICSSCISKVTNCPQCRTLFPPTKIRNRALEEILDGQEFECKFFDQGCAQILKRGVISSHAKFCLYRPIPLCTQIGFNGCNFIIGPTTSKTAIISHFKETHTIPLQPWQGQSNVILQISGEALRELITDRKRHQSDSNLVLWKIWNYLVTQDESETSPLFLLLGKADFIKQSLSFVPIKVCGGGSETFHAKFTLYHKFKDSLATNQHESGGVGVSMISFANLFPMRWSMNVCNIRDAHYFVKEPSLNISIPLLKNCQFGTDTDSLEGDNDSLVIEVCRA